MVVRIKRIVQDWYAMDIEGQITRTIIVVVISAAIAHLFWLYSKLIWEQIRTQGRSKCGIAAVIIIILVAVAVDVVDYLRICDPYMECLTCLMLCLHIVPNFCYGWAELIVKPEHTSTAYCVAHNVLAMYYNFTDKNQARAKPVLWVGCFVGTATIIQLIVLLIQESRARKNAGYRRI